MVQLGPGARSGRSGVREAGLRSGRVCGPAEAGVRSPAGAGRAGSWAVRSVPGWVHGPAGARRTGSRAVRSWQGCAVQLEAGVQPR